MKKKVYKAFNEQVQAELYSAYMYLAMSIDMEAKNFKGMAHWLKAQYEEEREHAFKLMGFMQDCGEKPELLAIEAPAADYGTPLELFKKVLEHEKYVTSKKPALPKLLKNCKWLAIMLAACSLLTASSAQENN